MDVKKSDTTSLMASMKVKQEKLSFEVEKDRRLTAEISRIKLALDNVTKRVADIMSEISAASAEQSNGIEQVNKAIMHMDEVTQQNAALVEEAAAAAESLREETQNLNQAVSIFKMNETASRKEAKNLIAQASVK